MQNITYENFIQDILENRGRFNCGEEYHERHHIIPKCLGGTNEEDNLIDLFAREHFIAHKLLAEENPDNTKLIYAWWCMSSMKNERTHNRYECTPEEYEQAKIAFSQVVSANTQRRFQDPEARQKQSEIQKKRFEDPEERRKNGEYTKKQYENPERRKKQSDTIKKKYEDPEMRKKTSEASKKMWQNDEYRQKQIDAALKYHNTPEGFKASSDGAKKKWSNPEARKKHSDRMGGEKNPRAKKVIRLSDLEVYGCILDAANKNTMDRNAMAKRCKNQQDFMYYEEWILVNNSKKDDDVNAI